MRSYFHSEEGFTLIELVATFSLALVMMGIASVYLLDFEVRAESGAQELSRFFKQARARAMSATLAYKIIPLSASRIGVETASSCSAGSFSEDNNLILDLPMGVQTTSLTWDVCYNARGLPDDNIAVHLLDNQGSLYSVEVMLGGGVRMYEGT